MDTPNPPPEKEQPDYLIEHAPTGRSRCKGCRRAIKKEALRVGFLFEGPYGMGYAWHHLTCAARKRPEDLEAAYRESAWDNAKVPPKKVPDLEGLKRSVTDSESKKTEKQEVPYAELDPSGRAKCKHCNEPLAKGEPRVVIGRKVEFGDQVRVGPIKIHAACVAEALKAEDCDTSPEGFDVAIRENSKSLSAEQIEQILKTIGTLPTA